MNTWFSLSQNMMDSIGLSLLHSLWQAAAIAAILFLLLRLMKQSSALSRYYLASSGLLLTALLPLIAIFKALSQPAVVAVEQLPTQNDDLLDVVFVLADVGFGFSGWIQRLEMLISMISPYVVWFWFAGMMFMLVRLSGGYLIAYRLKTRYIQPIENKYAVLAGKLATSMKISRKVLVFESFKVDVPMVIGYFKPVILLPAGLLTRIPYDQIEMILAHELAHIRRSDFLVNLLQSLVEVLLFFNPFVWWISSVIRQERENICDDMALAITGKGISLAKALVSLSEIPPQTIENSAILYFNKFNTMKRIERLFNNPRLKPSNMEKMVVSLMAIIAVLIISTTGSQAGSTDQNTDLLTVNSQETSFINQELPDVFIPDTAQDTLKKKKEVYIEMEDGRIKKAIIDGKEVPADKLEREDFVIIEKDTAEMKRVILKNGHPKFKTMVIETNELEWHQKPEDTTKVKVKKIMVNKSGDDNFVFIPVEGKPITLFEYPDHFADSLTLMWKDLESKLRESQLFNPDLAGNIFTITEKGLDTMMYMIKAGIEKGIYLDDKTFYSFPGHDDPIHRKEAAEYRKLIEMERELQRLEADASRMKNGAEREALRREAEGKRQEMEERRHEMEARRHEMEARRLDRNVPSHPRSMVIMDRHPEEYEMQVTIEEDIRYQDQGVDRKYLKLFKDELISAGVCQRNSVIVITRKQTIIDGNVLDQKSHKQFLKRFEDLADIKLNREQAFTIR